MSRPSSHASEEKWFLGEFCTPLASTKNCPARVEPHSYVNLEREIENRRDRNAIRVENGRFQCVGYLPRRIAAWLAPLVDAEQVRIEGYAPLLAGQSDEHDAVPQITVMVFLTPAGQEILRRPTAVSRPNNLHALVLQAYDDVQSLHDPQEILAFAQSLRRLALQQLLPETHLLLALIPSMAREARAAQNIRALALFRDRLEQLVIGTPQEYQGLSVTPLFWPESAASPYITFACATAQGLAAVEDVSQTGNTPQFRLLNKALQPLLIVAGEMLAGSRQSGVVNRTTLVAANSAFDLAGSCVDQVPGDAHSGKETQEPEKPMSVREHGPALPAATAGIVVGRGAQIQRIDLFDSPRTFADLWPRWSQCYVQKSGLDSRSGAATCPDQVSRFLRLVAGNARPRSSVVGLGRELKMCEGGVIGSALLYDQRICHLAAVAAPPNPDDGGRP